MKRMKFNFQLFKKGSSSTTTYQMSPEERALVNQQLKYQEAFYPNVIRLNEDAGNLLWDSYGDVQADFNAANQAAQQQIAGGQNVINGLVNGQMPAEYQQNMENAVRSGVQNSMGNALNSLANRGVLNSSVTNTAMNDISKNVSDTMAQNYGNNIQLLSGLGQQQIANAATPMTTMAAAQEGAQQPALNLWNASLGLQQSGNSVLGNIAGKYGTSTQTQKNGGGLGSALVSLGSSFLGGYGSALGSR